MCCCLSLGGFRGRASRRFLAAVKLGGLQPVGSCSVGNKQGAASAMALDVCSSWCSPCCGSQCVQPCRAYNLHALTDLCHVLLRPAGVYVCVAVRRHLKTDSDSEVLLNIFADEIHRAHQRFVQVGYSALAVCGQRGFTATAWQWCAHVRHAVEPCASAGNVQTHLGPVTATMSRLQRASGHAVGAAY